MVKIMVITDDSSNEDILHNIENRIDDLERIMKIAQLHYVEMEREIDILKRRMDQRK